MELFSFLPDGVIRDLAYALREVAKGRGDTVEVTRKGDSWDVRVVQETHYARHEN